MLKKYRYAKNPFAVSILCLIILSVIVDLVFIQYGKRIDREFQHLEEENLTAYAVTQSQQVESKISELLGRMKATGRLVVSSGLDPEGEWFAAYLKDVSELADYQVTYVSMDSLRAQMNLPGIESREFEILEKLEKGESVLSDLRYSNRLQGYYFAVAEPVIKDGKTIGALRCVMKADALTDDNADHVMHETYKQYIVSGDGTVLYSDVEEEAIGKNLLTDLKADGLSGDVLNQIYTALRQDGDLSVKISIPGHKIFYITTTAIGYKSWNIVKFAYTDKVNVTSRKMMKYTIYITIMVIGLIVIACAVVFGLIYSHKKRVLMERARYQTLASFFDIIIFEYRVKEDYLEFSSNVFDYFPISDNCVEGLSKHEFEVLHPDDIKLLFQYFERAQKTRMSQKWEMRFRNREDLYFWGECRCQAVDDGRCLIGTIIDISDRKEKELDLLKKTNSDPMTGILNKKAIEIAVDDMIKKQGEGFLFMIDIDNFKLVNDTYGHGVGDSLLIQVAEMLRNIFREHDPVARVGGDEFIAYMSDTRNPDIAMLKVNMFFSKLEEISKGNEYEITVSIGIATCPSDGSSFRELYEKADQAMYRAKKAGKHGYAFTCQNQED